MKWNKDVAHPDQPQGQVATRLREIVANSGISTASELKKRSHYAGATLSEAMGGRRRQTRSIISGIVMACVSDSTVAAAEIEEMLKILQEEAEHTASSGWQADQVTERPWPPREYVTAGPSAADAVELPVDEQDDLGSTSVEPADATGAFRTSNPPTQLSEGRAGQGAGTWLSRRRAQTSVRHLLVFTVLVLLVLAGAGYGINTLLYPMCGPEVAWVDGQCIGISDGSVNVASDPAFATILAKIKEENHRVLMAPDSAPVVSVAYVDPFPIVHGSFSDQTLRGLEGAYLMQLERNEAGGQNPLGGPPRVQLLVANLGAGALQQSSIIEQLQNLTDPANHAPLVAVIGLDQSLPGVVDAVRGLGRAGIPMVAGRAVADDFAADAVNEGFFSVAPPVHDQVAALVHYLGSRARKPLLVEDTTTTDLYGLNLADQFKVQFAASGGTPLPAPVAFNSSLPGLQTAFANVLPAICTLQPDVVFFAGRGANLPAFIQQLGTRPCLQVPVTVVTLSDGQGLAQAIRDQNAPGSTAERMLTETMQPGDGSAGVNVIATALAHPGVFSDQRLVPPGSRAALTGSFATAFPQQFPDQGVVDDGGSVILGHDAMQVVVEAIARGRPPQSSDPVTAGLVRQALSGITPYAPVYGASGPIAYSAAGFPLAKNIPITEISPFGQIYVLSPTAPLL